jgi:hypothetical protein
VAVLKRAGLRWLPAVKRGILSGLSRDASQLVGISYDPYNRSIRENLAEQLFQDCDRSEPVGTVRRSRLLLKIIEEGFPTPALATAYFQNLEFLLKAEEKRSAPGQLMLGLGTGRCGSTSLTSLLASVEGSCCTHENPPLIFWKPEREQVQFHLRRFELLMRYFPLVVDVSHWWLNVLDNVFSAFPKSKAIGMHRDADRCVQSFMRIKRYGRQSWNHWVPYGNDVWATHSWDPTYPTYSIPIDVSNPDRIKDALISRYVWEYNVQLKVLAERFANKVMLVKTEEFNEPTIQERIFDFAGVAGHVSKHNLNVRSVTDGINEDLRF